MHCGTDDEEEEKTKKTVCDDGIHCGTDDEEEQPAKKKCDDGIHCGTDDEDETSKSKETSKKKTCDDGMHCGTDDEEEEEKTTKKTKKVCDDGMHCGTDDEEEDKPKKKVCEDGIHCGTDDEEEEETKKKTKKVCDDGIHCGTDDEDETSKTKDSSKKKTCDDGIHCGTDDEDETSKSKDSSKKKTCDDGIHCGTDDEEETSKTKETSKKKTCDDGIHCGTDDEDETSKSKETSKKKTCEDGIHCGTDDEDEKPAAEKTEASDSAASSTTPAAQPSTSSSSTSGSTSTDTPSTSIQIATTSTDHTNSLPAPVTTESQASVSQVSTPVPMETDTSENTATAVSESAPTNITAQTKAPSADSQSTEQSKAESTMSVTVTTQSETSNTTDITTTASAPLSGESGPQAVVSEGGEGVGGDKVATPPPSSLQQSAAPPPSAVAREEKPATATDSSAAEKAGEQAVPTTKQPSPPVTQSSSAEGSTSTVTVTAAAQSHSLSSTPAVSTPGPASGTSSTTGTTPPVITCEASSVTAVPLPPSSSVTASSVGATAPTTTTTTISGVSTTSSQPTPASSTVSIDSQAVSTVPVQQPISCAPSESAVTSAVSASAPSVPGSSMSSAVTCASTSVVGAAVPSISTSTTISSGGGAAVTWAGTTATTTTGAVTTTMLLPSGASASSAVTNASVTSVASSTPPVSSSMSMSAPGVSPVPQPKPSISMPMQVTEAVPPTAAPIADRSFGGPSAVSSKPSATSPSMAGSQPAAMTTPPSVASSSSAASAPSASSSAPSLAAAAAPVSMSPISAVSTASAAGGGGGGMGGGGPHSRPQLAPLSMGGGGSMHYPSDHPLAGQPRPPLDMLAHVSHSALSSAGTSIPSSQPSPPESVMRGGVPPLSPHLSHHGMSPGSQHSPTMSPGAEGAGYIPRHMYASPMRFRGMAPRSPVEFPRMMSPPQMSPTSPSQRGQRPQFPPFHGGPEMMHHGMGPRGPHGGPMLPPPPDVMSKSPNADGPPPPPHMAMMRPPHMQGYPHPPPPPHSQAAMMNRPPYNIHPPPPHSSGGPVDFPPSWPPHQHPRMSMANFHGHHRMPVSGPGSAPHSPSSGSPLRMQGPGFPKEAPPHMMPGEPHMMGQGDCMAGNLRMFAEQQQRMGMMRPRHPMMPPGASAFPPHQHQRLPQPRHPMFPPEEDPFALHPSLPSSSTPSSIPDPHLAISQALSPMGPGGPRPSFPEAVSLAPTSSMGPMMSSAGMPVSSAPMEHSGLKGLDMGVGPPGMPGAVLTKVEPGTQSPDMGGDGQDMDPEQRAKHNALLKQLLSKEQAAATFRGEPHPPSTPDSEESLPQLTPEQQRQLELIDMMPLCKETESPSDMPDWDTKSHEEKEHILELRKQEYEKKRKQYEAVRKKRKNQPQVGGPESGGGAGALPVPKVKKRRTKSQAPPTPTPPVDPTSLSTADLQTEPASSKKKGRRNKNRESRLEQRESELEFMAETFLQQLHSLPSVPLREPDIKLVYSIVPIKGAPNVTGVSLLRGVPGQGYLDMDFDLYHSMTFPPPPSSLQPSASSITTAGALREKEMKHSPEIVTCVAPATSSVSTPVVSSPSVGLSPMVQEAGPFALPAHPRIEVKLEPLSELAVRDTPDTIISSSSPECGFAEQESEFTSLRPIDPASPTGGTVDDKHSPTVPLLAPIPRYPKLEKGEVAGKEVKPQPITPISSRPSSLPDMPPAARQSLASEQALVPASASKQEDVGTQVENPHHNLTVKVPMSSGLTQPLMDPALDQKVSVTLTLSANASEDIGGVISAIADLLKIAVPPTYEITRTPSPEMFKMNMSHKEDVINIQALMRTKSTFCGHCHVVLINSGIRKHKSELPPELVPEDLGEEEEVTWCSMNCMNQFLQTGPHIDDSDDMDDDNIDDNATNDVDNDQDSSNTSTLIMDGDQPNNNNTTTTNNSSSSNSNNKAEPDSKLGGGDVGRGEECDTAIAKPSLSLLTSLPITEALSVSTASPALSASASATTQPGTPTTPTAGMSTFSSPSASPAHSLSLTSPPGVRGGHLGSPLHHPHPLLSPPLRGGSKEERGMLGGKRHRRSSSTTSQEGFVIKSMVKRWRDDRWKRWDSTMTVEQLPEGSSKELNEFYQKLKEVAALQEEFDNTSSKLWESLDMAVRPGNLPDDQRVCALCLHKGDGESDGCSRLLNYDVDKWVHLNCALWSLEVYETLNGALMNVDVAFTRGASTECVVCRKPGATLGCFRNRCANSYHLPCARTKGCIFFQDKTIICANHNNTPRPFPDSELLTLEVRRRVYINRDEDRQVASMVTSLIHPDEGKYTVRIGSLILHCIGQLLPHQIQTNKFNTREFIYPVGFRSTRFYWSHRKLYKRCRYLCSITDNQGAPEFIINIKEEGHDDVVFRDSSAKNVWMNILQPLKDMHNTADMVKMFPEFMCMEELFGLSEPSILRVLESLPGADLLHNYNFKYGRSPLIEMPPAINPTGCARTEPKLRTHFKRRPHTLHSSQSRSLPSTVTSVTGDINSPYMKQFVHSKSQQYRRLKTEWKNLVYLGRSSIQGLGLYATRDLEKHTMVIEYIGDLIRNEVANRREREYDEQNRGVYMFRIDNDTVIDATMAGGPARYINHSCSPNCVAEVVPFEKDSKIIIITSRRIPKGEELTYDYKFDFEDDQHKIPCLCGATFCRKWMN